MGSPIYLRILLLPFFPPSSNYQHFFPALLHFFHIAAISHFKEQISLSLWFSELPCIRLNSATIFPYSCTYRGDSSVIPSPAAAAPTSPSSSPWRTCQLPRGGVAIPSVTSAKDSSSIILGLSSCAQQSTLAHPVPWEDMHWRRYTGCGPDPRRRRTYINAYSKGDSQCFVKLDPE